MHQYKIKLTDDSILFFKSKHNICKGSIQFALIHSKAFLVFEDADVMINTDQIKKLSVDGIEYRAGNYVVH